MCRLVLLDYNGVKAVALPLWLTATLSQNPLFIVLTYINTFRFKSGVEMLLHTDNRRLFAAKNHLQG
jgi:hypothetical protein